MERAIIYYAKTGLEATDHFVPKLLEKYCQDNGYEIVAMLSEPVSYTHLDVYKRQVYGIDGFPPACLGIWHQPKRPNIKKR